MHAAIFSVTEASRLLAIFHIHIYTGVSPLSVAIDVLRAAQTVREGWMQRIPRMQTLPLPFLVLSVPPLAHSLTHTCYLFMS